MFLFEMVWRNFFFRVMEPAYIFHINGIAMCKFGDWYKQKSFLTYAAEVISRYETLCSNLSTFEHGSVICTLWIMDYCVSVFMA
jgi:hypothetical protein